MTDRPRPPTEGEPGVAADELDDAGESFDVAESAPGGTDALLSRDESNALLDAIRAGSLPPPATLGPVPERASLGAPDAPLRRAIGKAERASRELAHGVQVALLSLGSVLAEMQLLESNVMAVDTALGAFDERAASWDVLIATDGAPRATLIVGPTLTERLLARRLGASDAVGTRAGRSRGVSALARRLLEPFAAACLAPIAEAFLAGAGPVGLVSRGGTSVAGFSPCLRVAVRVLFADVEDEVAVLIHEAALVVRPPRAADGIGDRELFSRGLSDVEVELAALLGRAHASVRELCRWSVGAVLRLDGSPERPIVVCVDGVPVFSAMPIVHEGNIAIEVRS